MYAFLRVRRLPWGAACTHFHVCLCPWGAGCIHFCMWRRPLGHDVCILTCASMPGEHDVCIFVGASAPGEQNICIIALLHWIQTQQIEMEFEDVILDVNVQVIEDFLSKNMLGSLWTHGGGGSSSNAMSLSQQLCLTYGLLNERLVKDIGLISKTDFYRL